ncbi:hypothetical protein PTKIN_Ptkin09bG0234900 [Pterospermum kingtungense]
MQGFCQSQLTRIAAQKAKLAAEEWFKLGNVEKAIEQAFAAFNFNPDLPSIQSYITAYLVHKLAPMQGFYRRKKRDESEVLRLILFIEDCSDVDEATIKRHYKEMARLVHPDKNDSVAAEGAFRIVRDAFETLLLTHQRKRRKAADRR